jgi:hypothetical protein
MKNIILNKTESFIWRNTSDHACQIFCSKINCATMYMFHWFFLLEKTVVNIMNNLNVCSAHSYLYHRSRFKLYIYIEYVNTSPQIRIILSHIQCAYMYCQKIIFAESIISSRTLTLMLALTLTITLLLSYSHGNEMKGYVSCKLIITISNFRGPPK